MILRLAPPRLRILRLAPKTEGSSLFFVFCFCVLFCFVL
jgi:hypothetical protein